MCKMIILYAHGFYFQTVQCRRAGPCPIEHPPHADLRQFCLLPARVSLLAVAEVTSAAGNFVVSLKCAMDK